MTQEEQLHWMSEAEIYAKEHSKGKDVWVRDALYVAYLTAIQDITKTKLL